MLDQETQIKVEESTDNSTLPTTTANAEVTTNDCKSTIEQPQEQKNPQLNKDNPLLNDHDYCSPNKISRQLDREENIERETEGPDELEMTMPSHNDQRSQANIPIASECLASTSESPAEEKDSSQLHNKNTIPGTMNDHVDDGNLSDSSSSSSSISSEDSDGLIIADPRPKSLAPKDTPSVSRPKVGNRPSLKLEMSQHFSKQENQTRQRRPRQNTSVTDKSQWITGEDQVDTALSEHLSADRREKRQRKEVNDPDFSHFTSSDEYSSSDAPSDDADSSADENDPNRPWCQCMKPHGGKFMICCDICEYWYHGMCVGVTEQMSKRFEREGKEWFCGECQTHLQNGTPRQAIPKKVVKKEKKKKVGRPGKRGRGRPKKSESLTRETRLSSRIAAKKPNTSLDSRLGTRRNPNKSDLARSESFEEFDNEERLKVLIKERKREFLFKRSLANQQRAVKMRELGVGRHSLTAPLGNSLDSLATTTSSPNMNNLPMNIKPEERAKPNIVLQINTKKDGGVTAVVKSKKRKQSESSDQLVDELFTADPIQISKKPEPVIVLQREAESLSASDRRASNGSKNDKNNSSEQHSTTAHKKRRKDSESNTTAAFGSKEIANKIKDCLETRAKQLKDFEIPSTEKIENLAAAIESQLNENFKEGSQKYLNKYRSLIFNLRDAKNQVLVKNVLTGEIHPSRLVKMSPEEMASHELAKWRERENKHAIELIKRDAQLAVQQVIVKKTHKGEEVISAPALNDPDDPTADVKNQEPPTTPTKMTTKEVKDGQAGVSPSSSTDVVNPVSTPVASSTTIKKISIQLPPQKDYTPPLVSLVETLPFLDTTKDHKNHLFDINCKLCTKQGIDSSKKNDKEADSEPKADSGTQADLADAKVEPTAQQSEPKRLRVSIETNLNLSNLSRLRDQPLIKPSERPPDSGEYSPSKVTPDAESISNEDEEEELYDPETMLPRLDSLQPKDIIQSASELAWSGSITMPDVCKFTASVKPISGNPAFMREEISQNLLVCGRIKPEQVNSYIKKLRATTKNQIISIQFQPQTDSDKASYDTLFDYLYTRNRCGVIENGPHSQILRDFYIIPVHEGGGVPEMLKPIQGPGLEKSHPNCLLGLMVKTKRPTSALSGGSASASSSSASPSITSYTPTPIK